ncbi:MAG: hypothetical protein ABI361_08660 [Nitrososphaera sp.]|jgi:hypothetical protein
MKFNINRHLFAQINVDSAALNLLSSAVHRFSQPGEYSGIISSGQNVTGRFSLTVVESQANPQVPGRVKIDLKSTQQERFSVKAGGYCTFYVSAGPGNYSVEVSRLESEGFVKEFDSKELKSGDYFSATVIRPGSYSILNAIVNTRSELIVNYPEAGKAQRGAPAVNVECAANQMSPARVMVDPPQGLVFVCKTASRIKIELTRPDDRPSRVHARLAAFAKTQAQTSHPQGSGEKKPIRRYQLMPSGAKTLDET